MPESKAEQTDEAGRQTRETGAENPQRQRTENKDRTNKHTPSKPTTREELQQRQGSKPSPERRSEDTPEFAKTQRAETRHQQGLQAIGLTKTKKSPIFVTRTKHKPKQERTTEMNKPKRNTRPQIAEWKAQRANGQEEAR